MTKKRDPLNERLRREADEWNADEPARAVLIEAAEALERLAAEVARLIIERSATT